MTIKEAALAGVLGVILNFLFIYYGLGAITILDTKFIVIGLTGGFILSFVGGWIGEEMQKRKEAKAK